MQGSNDKSKSSSQKDPNAIWLVKSAGEIKGPFTFEEVVEGLHSKEFILVDEVAKKFSRWKYIRDEEQFEKAVNELKNREDMKGEKTFTNSTTDILTEDLTDKVLNFSAKEHLVSKIEEQMKRPESKIEDVQDLPQDTGEKVKKFVSEKELKRKSQKNFFVQLLLILALISVSAIYFLQNKKEQVLSLEDLKKQAFSKINYGDFEKARYYLQKALTFNERDEDLKYLLAFTDLQLEDSLSAQKILADLTVSATKPQIKSQSFNLAGVIQLKNFNMDQAKLDFKKALEFNPKYIQATYNQGVTYYLENNFDGAFNNFQEALQNGANDGTVYLSLVESMIRAHKDDLQSEDIKMKFAELILQIEKFIGHNYAYKQELMIADAYLNFYLGKKENMDSWIGRALMIDPQLTADMISDVSYYHSVVTWDKLSEWIAAMRDANTSNNDLKTLYAYAQFRGSEKLKGKDSLEALLRSDYANVSNQILHAYTLMSLNRDAEAKAALLPVMHYADQVLNFYFMGEICLKEKDLNCALENFDKVLKTDNNHLGAMAGLGEVYWQQQNFPKAQEIISRAMITASFYRPILAVKEKLDERVQQ